MKGRGLKGVELLVSDKCLGLVENVVDFYPEAKWQRCVVHFYRNVWTANLVRLQFMSCALGAPCRIAFVWP